ncbi:cupin domain-containing protein [Vibrio pectenicida]|uniref:Cupin domain-containing protein n=1 Tax=Vibrio pectenicida TaxID=62763 RepID=A0A7Y4EEX1_9VIBR|nr:cupin domain-containing protein [Vibrio pectenicida]NOH73205.1 cupin domain-containing protein [Vibrio pectenicida]
MITPKKITEVQGDTFNPFPEPFKSKLGHSECRSLGDVFGLSQFGVNLELLAPNSRSSLRHWHTKSDEFIYMVEGELILATNEGEQPLSQGMCVGFPAGIENGHCLINRSNTVAKFMVIGSRVSDDKAVYSDDDFSWVVNDQNEWIASDKKGTPY